MFTHSPNKLIPEAFTPVPSEEWLRALSVQAVSGTTASTDVVGMIVASDSRWPGEVPLGLEMLTRHGFHGGTGQSLVIPQGSGPAIVLVGTGPADELTNGKLRDAASTFARAASRFGQIDLRVTEIGQVHPNAATQAVVEGLVLARYRYRTLQSAAKDAALLGADIHIDGVDDELVTEGIDRAWAAVRAAVIARDLTNTPPGHLTATNFGEAAQQLGATYGFDVEVFDLEAIIQLGCGGLLGVNAGSLEEPRIVKLVYPGSGAGPRVAVVGKGIMYDSGGISLKPSDPMHLLMKMDMGGAAAVLGMFTALADRKVSATVSAWLMCTDNMPSGSAYKLGDVLTARGGKTVEVKNTDAEGRLVMMDGLALAVETAPDAILDIATLTGAALMALGPLTAALFGNDEELIDRVRSAAEQSGEQVWQLPLEGAYRKQLDSQIADLANLGGKYAGSTTAALFLQEFVANIPWAHLDIAGTMQSDTDDLWRPAGATGYGARLLLEIVAGFNSVSPASEVTG